MSLSPPPLIADVNAKGGKTSISWMSWFQNLFNTVAPLGTNGVTATRPTANTYVGQQFFDTTLGKPVFLKQVSPAVWVDATGAPV